MSPCWQLRLLLTILCVALAGGPTASTARAQCNHGGGLGPRVSQGLIAQQLLQQQLFQQMQLIQRVRQQQLLQTAKLARQMRELAKEGPEALKTALKNPHAEMRLLAALTVGKYGPALTDDLIERLTDDNATVRQAARPGASQHSARRQAGQGSKRRFWAGAGFQSNCSGHLRPQMAKLV